MPKSNPSFIATSASDHATPLPREPISYRFVSEKNAAEICMMPI
jgi:hypothetical protein